MKVQSKSTFHASNPTFQLRVTLDGTMTAMTIASPLLFAVSVVWMLLVVSSPVHSVVTYSGYNLGLIEVPGNIALDVTTVNLDKNAIMQVEDLAFAAYTQLDTLKLSTNAITSVSPTGFNNTVITDLYLSSNLLTEFPPLNLIGNTLDMLKMNLNDINTMASEVLSSLSVLRFLDVSYNQLASLENITLLAGCLEDLVVNNNPNLGPSIGPHTFLGMRILRLYMNSTGLTAFPQAALASLESTLISMDLSYNAMGQVSCEQLQNFSLSILRLSSIGLTSWPDLSCMRLSLRDVELFSNGIPNIPRDAFLGFTKLKYFYISGNPITNFPLFGYVGNSLTNIVARSTALTDLSSESFQNVTTLSQFILGTTLQFPSLDSLTPLKTLSTLEIGGHVNHISEQFFQGMAGMTVLKLSFTQVDCMEMVGILQTLF